MLPKTFPYLVSPQQGSFKFHGPLSRPNRKFSAKINRPFSVRYDPFTCSVEVLDQPEKIQHTLGQMKEDLRVLHTALEKLA